MPCCRQSEPTKTSKWCVRPSRLCSAQSTPKKIWSRSRPTKTCASPSPCRTTRSWRRSPDPCVCCRAIRRVTVWAPTTRCQDWTPTQKPFVASGQATRRAEVAISGPSRRTHSSRWHWPRTLHWPWCWPQREWATVNDPSCPFTSRKRQTPWSGKPYSRKWWLPANFLLRVTSISTPMKTSAPRNPWTRHWWRPARKWSWSRTISPDANSCPSSSQWLATSLTNWKWTHF